METLSNCCCDFVWYIRFIFNLYVVYPVIESLNTIYNGSATIIKNKEYLSAKAYIEPFVERLSDYTSKFICLVKNADQISYDNKGINYIYNRVLVYGVLPDNYDVVINRNDKSVNYHRVVCMVYALDVKNPICKFYSGVVDSDFNFYAFGANCISIQKIEPETPIDFTSLQSIIDNGLKDNCEIILSQNTQRSISKNIMTNTLGEWIDFSIKKEYINDSGKVKLSNSMPIEAYKRLIIERESDYYTDEDNIEYPELLQSFLSQITEDEKDIINRYEKTQLINQMLKL